MTESQAGEFEQGDDLDVEQPARYQRTTNGLLGALIVTVIVVGLFVGFRETFRSQPTIERDAVDYLGTVQAAQDAGIELVYPVSLPKGWIATSIDFVPGQRPAWGIGMLTDEGRFVGIRQEDADIDELLGAYVDKDAEPGDESRFVSELKTDPWQTWADTGGDLAFSTTLTVGGRQTLGETLLVYGSAPRVDQEELIALLTEADVK